MVPGSVKNRGWIGGTVRVMEYILVAFLIITPIRLFVAQPFIVSGESMAPTFEQNEYVVIDKFSYRFGQPQRGDIIIFRYPLDDSQFFIKRVVGLPGEEVDIANGVVTVTGTSGVPFILDEPYRSSTMTARPSDTKLADGEYFVMGDNRSVSSDSREWGPLQKRYIVGRALISLFPLRDATLYPGQYRYPAKK